MTTFTGELGVAVYRATVIAHGLRLYAKTGLRPNRAYTPTAMMKAAKEITGKTFKSRDYEGAAEVLLAFAKAKTLEAQGLGEIY